MTDSKDLFTGMNIDEVETKRIDPNNNQNATRFPLDASFQGVNRLFVLALNNVNNGANKIQGNSHRKYFFSRVDITKYNVLIDGRNFFISQLVTKSKSMMKLEKL